jgi:hypothetical protein
MLLKRSVRMSLAFVLLALSCSSTLSQAPPNWRDDLVKSLSGKRMLSTMLDQMQAAEEKFKSVSKPCMNKTMQFLKALEKTEIWAITSKVAID